MTYYSILKKQEHKEHLKIILQVWTEYQLFVMFRKCGFFNDRIQYVGHVVSNDGISIDPNKIKSITEWPIPNNVTNIRSFMGITGYYRKFVEGFSKISYSITSLPNKGKKFE